MGTYKDSRSSSSTAKSHNKRRWYVALGLTTERDRLIHYIETHTGDLWLVELIKSDEITDTFKLRYGPVHGNSPSDVTRLFKNGKLKLLAEVKPLGKPEHVSVGCRHPACMK